MSPMLHYKTVICKDFRGLRGTQETRDKYTERVPVNFTPLISCWLVKPNRSFQPFSCLSVKHTSQKHPVGQIQLQYFPNIFLIKKSNLSRNLKWGLIDQQASKANLWLGLFCAFGVGWFECTRQGLCQEDLCNWVHLFLLNAWVMNAAQLTKWWLMVMMMACMHGRCSAAWSHIYSINTVLLVVRELERDGHNLKCSGKTLLPGLR